MTPATRWGKALTGPPKCTLDRPRSGLPPRSGPLFLCQKPQGDVPAAKGRLVGVEHIHSCDLKQASEIVTKDEIVFRELSTRHVLVDVTEQEADLPDLPPASIIRVVKQMYGSAGGCPSLIDTSNLCFVAEALTGMGILLEIDL